MKIRAALTILLLATVPLSAQAAKEKAPLTIETTSAATGLPLVTLTASETPLGEIAGKLAESLGTTIEVSESARDFRVTTALDEQPLDLTLRELAPQAFIDGTLTGGTGQTTILTIHLRSAGESAPPLDKLKTRTAETFMISGHTEDAALDPLEGGLDVTYRNGRLRVLAKRQALSVVVARLAEVLDIPFELVGDSREMVDVSLSEATIEQVVVALTPSVKLYHRRDLATLTTTPVRLVIEEPSKPE